MLSRAEKYLCETDKKPDIVIEYVPDYFDEVLKSAPHFTYNECEIMVSSKYFYSSLLQHQGFMLHSSAIAVDNKAYLFSANSGTGKSTHTSLWRQYLGDRAVIINDDKPAIRVVDGKIYAYGTPWSGKSDLNLNVKVPLQAICLLERSAENFIEPMPVSDAIYKILSQTIRPPVESAMSNLLSLLDKVMTETPLWRLGCNISLDAARLAYETMSKEIIK